MKLSSTGNLQMTKVLKRKLEIGILEELKRENSGYLE